ncbi:MAG TPA: glycosyltransferase family A protein [Stellaceae bacterium]|nr:glycosyltransferase family A protein [Stellaceae bacterium]
MIMPNKNDGRWLRASVASVLRQDFSDYELVIIDDNSSDDSLAVLRDLADSDHRIRVICSQQDLGVGQARNLGMECAKGELISFLDADDLMLPDTLRRQISAFDAARRRNPGVQLMATDAYLINERGERFSRYMPVEWWDRIEDRTGPMVWSMPFEMALQGTMVVASESKLRFMPEWKVAEVPPFLHRAHVAGGATYVGMPLVEVRLRLSSVTYNRSREILRSVRASLQTIAAGTWDRPVLPSQVADPRWSEIWAWKYGRLARSATANRHYLLAAAASGLAFVANPGLTVMKLNQERRRRKRQGRIERKAAIRSR